MRKNKDEKALGTKNKLLSEHIHNVQNDTVNNAKFISKNGTTLPKNLRPVFVVNENLANYYTAIHKENVSKTFSLNGETKMELIYQKGRLTHTPLFASSDVGKLINTSMDTVVDKKMKGYEDIARALRASEALDANNMHSIISNAVKNGRHTDSLTKTKWKTTTAIAQKLDRDSMDTYIEKTFNDFIWGMRKETSGESAGIREQIRVLNNAISKEKNKIDVWSKEVKSSPNKSMVNRSINSANGSINGYLTKISELEKELGPKFDEVSFARMQGHLENLSSNNPVVTDELVNDYYSYISKKDTDIMSYFESMSEAYDEADDKSASVITEMLNDSKVMDTGSHKTNPSSRKTYEKLRRDIRNGVVQSNGALSDEVLEEMSRGVDSLELQKLTASQKIEAMNMIENIPIKKFVDASYVEYSENDAISYKPLNYISTMGTTYQSPDGNYSVMIKGLDDIENLNPNHIDKYLKDLDAYADIDVRHKESMKLGDGLYADTLLTKLKHFKEFQENKDMAAIRSQFDAVAFHGAKEYVPEFVTQPSRESVNLNPRVKSMIPKELADGMPNSVPISSDILNSIERNKNVFDIMETVIKPLSKQTSDNSLRIEAEETIMAFNLFKQVRSANGFNEQGNKNIDAMNDIIASSYSGKYSAAGADGDIARMYESSLKFLRLDEATPFSSLEQQSQLAIMDEIEGKMVSKLSKRIDNLKYGLEEKTYNKELQKERERVSEQRSAVNSEVIEIENLYNGGLIKDDDEAIEAAKTSLWEHDHNARTRIEAEREAMKSQRISLLENLDNAGSNVDKKDYQGILAYTKGTSEIRHVRDVGRLGGHTNYLTYEELMEGIVRDGDQYVPIEQFKQYHSMMDATQLMKSKPSGEFKDINKYMFSPKEWKRGSVVIGNSEIPITQFKEYYDRDVRVDRATWLRNNTPNSANDSSLNVGYTQSDYHNIHKLSVLEDTLSNDNARIVVEKPIDRELVNNLNKWQEGGMPIILKGSDISKEIVGVDGNTVALKSRSALASQTKFSIDYNGEGTLFEALMKFDEIIGSTGKSDRYGSELIKSMRGSKLVSEVSYEDAYNGMKRDRMDHVIGTADIDGQKVQITRTNLLQRINEDTVQLKDILDGSKGDTIPRLIHDTSMINFSWMGVAGENMSELLGAGISSLDKAINSTSDEAILEAFAKNGVGLGELHTIDNKKAHSIMMDAFGHRAKLEMLFEYLGKDGSPSGDSADTAIRVARKVNEMHGISNTTDNIYSSLAALKKGIGKLEDDDTKKYFSVIDKLIANDHSMLQKVLENPTEVLTDFMETKSRLDDNSVEAELDGFQKDIQDIFNLKAPQEEVFEKANLNMSPNALNEKIEDMAKSSDYYISKTGKYTKHKGDIQLRVADTPSFDYKTNQRIGQIEATKLMTETLDQFESEDIGKDLKAILSNRVTIGNGKDAVDGTIKQLIIKDVLSSFGNQKMTLYSMNKRLGAALDKHMDNGILENAKAQVNRIEALRVLNDEVPGAAVNYIRANGGIVSAFGELGIVPKGDAGAVGNMKMVEKAIGDMAFGSAEDIANFSLIQELIPGLNVRVQTKDASGNIINGTIGSHRTHDGMVDTVITTTNGEKVKLVDTDGESFQILRLNGLDTKDFRTANNNVAVKHMSQAIEDSATHYNIAAGFSGNYSVMSRRPYGTGGVDPMTMIKNMSDFTSDKSQVGLVFDFETTGLPNKLSDSLFAPIEFSYLAYDKKYRTGSELDFENNASRVVTKYAKPNKDVKKFFSEAMEDETYVDLFGTSKKNVGKDNSAFMLLKNYAKYDNTEVSFAGKNYTWGSILTSEMSVDKNDLGKVIAHIGDEEIHTNLSVAQIVNQIKQSGQDVFNYLSSGGAKGSDAMFGIDGKDIKTEKELVKTAVKKMNSYNKLIGHNITTADLKWLRRWADRLGIGGLSSDIETKAIDTQDILQASQPGRKSNKLSDHTDDIASAHLAYADIRTNISLFNKLSSDKTIGALAEEVERGVSNGDYLVKIANQELGMSQIPKGRYQVNSIENGADGVSGILSLRNMTTNTIEEYTTDNLAVIKKELADNWVSFGSDGIAAFEHSSSVSLDDASRTLYNAFGKPAAVDRYIQYGRSDFSTSKAVLEDMHNSIYNATLKTNGTKETYEKNALETSINLLGLSHKTTEELADGVFESRGVSDIEKLIISNSSKLTGKGYINELIHLADNASTRKEEFKHVADYFDTDEGKLAKKYLKKINYREQAGVITKAQRRMVGDTLYQRVMDVKREAIKSNNLNGFEQTIEGKFVIGALTKKEASKYRGILGDKFVEVFKDKELILDLRNAEQTRRSIFSMSDSLAGQIHYRSSGSISLDEAQAKVVNEVILPILSKYSTNKELQESIMAYGTSKANPDYMHAVNSLATEFSSRKAELSSEGGALYGKGYKTLIATNGVSGSVNHTVLKDIEEAMEMTLDELDISASSIKTVVDGKLVDVPVPGGVEKIRELADIMEANEAAGIQAISELDSYKKNVANGYDPIANGINPVPMLDFSHNNSGGIAKLNVIDKASEWRITDNPDTQWMTYRRADELLDIANNLQTHTDAYEIPKIIRALKNEKIKPDDAKYYKDNFKEAIAFIESKVKHSVHDIAGIEQLNEATIQKISNQYSEMRKSNTNGNTFEKSSIMRELMNRASMKVDTPALENGLITLEMIKKNPTKYNAMKALGLMQPTSDNKAYYTGRIGGIDNFNNVYSSNGSAMSLDPSKVLLLGNERINIGGEQIRSNQLAGVPITHLTKNQLEHIAGDRYINRQQKSHIENYLDRVRSNESYDQEAQERYKKYVADVKAAYTSPSQDIIKELNEKIVNDHGSKAKETAENAINGHPNIKGVDPSKVVEDIKRITDHPLYGHLVDTLSESKEQAKKMLRGVENSQMVKFGAIGLGVGVGLKLVGNYTNSGRRPEENPNGGAPRVDGTYDNGYNKGGRPSIGSQTVRLEESGRGLNISAKAKNRNNTSDSDLNDMLSGMLGKSFGSNVNIKYQDDRSVIDNSYVQNLVSNALFS